MTGTDDERLAADEAAMEAHAAALLHAVETALGPWVRAAVRRHLPGPSTPELQARIEAASMEAETEVGRALAELLALDVDDQWTNPLSIIRTAVAYPTEILRNAGVAPVERDLTAVRVHPDDVYDLSPLSFGELGEGVKEPGIAWGAAKAHIHLSRRRREGSR